jgi:ABC-type uncharacterized transport system auxiliary subunit
VGQIGDQASLTARWWILDSSGAEVTAPRIFQHTEPSREKSTEALVAAMSRALGALSTEITAGVANVSAP